MMKPYFLLALIVLASCSGKRQEGSGPKPQAWPRVEVYKAGYHAMECGGVTMQVHDSARVAVDSATVAHQWLTLRYPRYQADLYITVAPVHDQEVLATTLANRRERMSLNALGGASTATLLRSGPYDAELLSTPTGTVTPLQFLAWGRGRVVSGAVYLPPAADPMLADSLAPVTEALAGDIIHLLQHLK